MAVIGRPPEAITGKVQLVLPSTVPGEVLVTRSPFNAVQCRELLFLDCTFRLGPLPEEIFRNKHPWFVNGCYLAFKVGYCVDSFVYNQPRISYCIEVIFGQAFIDMLIAKVEN